MSTRATASHRDNATYRREIDGLRALSVVAVLLFHAGISPFSGGYAGVDVFFVISGYLITSLLQNDHAPISLALFYERRARRILPALFFVTACSTIAAWFLLDPEQLVEFGKSTLATSAFVSNLFFWKQTGYFSLRATEEPLLHTWSLAVEEQFYLTFPLLLFVLRRLARHRLAVVIIALSLCSFSLCAWASHHARSANFYWTPTRVWELLCGSLLFFLETSRPVIRLASHRTLNNVFGLFGLVLICGAFGFFDSSTPYPGTWTAIPVAGTALVILSARQGTLAWRLLSTKPLVAIGLVSYSAYLWHYPLFVYARLSNFGDVSRPQLLALVGGSLVLAAATWRYVEQPCRDTELLSRKGILVGSLTLTAIFASAGIAMIASSGFPTRVDMSYLEKDSFSFSPKKDDCFESDAAEPLKNGKWYCAIGNLHKHRADFMLFGDSHSLSILPAVEAVAQAYGMLGFVTSVPGCAPLRGTYLLNMPQEYAQTCAARNHQVLSYAKAQRVQTIILAARWASFTEGRISDPDDFIFIGPTPSSPVTRDSSRNTFVVGLRDTIDEYRAIGARVVILKQVPWQLRDAKRVYFAASHSANGNIEGFVRNLSIGRSRNDSFFSFVNGEFDRYRARSDVMLVDPATILCESDVCPMGDGSASFYYDDNHLSVPGSRKLVQLMTHALVR